MGRGKEVPIFKGVGMVDRKFKLNTTPTAIKCFYTYKDFTTDPSFPFLQYDSVLKSLGHRKKHDDKQLCVATACDLIDHRANQNVCVFSA